jgi:hypothetical protein
MRSPYSIYDDYYVHVLETINSKCGLKKPTEIPPPIIPAEKPSPTFCASAMSYITVAGDTCSSIALARNVSSSGLWLANQALIRNCSSIAPGQRLCLPYQCSKVYSVKPADTCDGIEIREDLFYGTLRRHNPWLSIDCSNLQSGVKNMGSVLCLTSPGGNNLTLVPPTGVAGPSNGLRSGG